MDKFNIITKYDKKQENIFNLLSIDGNYHVIGSASLKGNRYRNDYDLNGLFISKGKKEDVEKYLYKVFLNKFNEAYKTNNVWITDFKCGMDSDGESLRWDYKDMKKGFKVMSNGRKILFTECLLQKSTMKMDIVSIVDGIMTEFSEMYYITIGGKSNFLEFDSAPEYIQNQLLHSYYEYLESKQDYFKALKRAFAYKRSVDKIKYKNQLLKMLEFFNSDAGVLNKIKSELDTMIIMKEQTFKPVPKSDYNMNIMKIMEFIQAHPTIKLKVKLTDDLSSIEKLKDKINNELQTDSLKFIKLNPDVLINKI